MKISIGILAWNEAQSIHTTIHSLLSQSLIQDPIHHEIELICVPNGCADNTAEAARQAFSDAPQTLRWRVEELKAPGKTNAWNVFVHELSRPDSELFFLMDADIRIQEKDTLSNMVAALTARPDLLTCSDRPIKHIALKKRRTLLDKLSLHAAKLTADADGQLCGQLYCARADFLRRFHIPDSIIVDDGFIKKMAVTNLLTEPDDSARRMTTAENASHLFESYSRFADVFATQRRQAAGYIIHRWIWKFLLEQQQENEDAGKTIDRLCAADPAWSEKLIASRLKDRKYRPILRVILRTRVQRFKNCTGTKKALQFPILLLHLSMDTVVFFAAVRQLRRKGRIWRDTRTTHNEVAR
ncbi:MAG: glycosyltransferase family 2 protein [Kiritimatiellales bacterium]|nr:glycosyltransferase family 2 protein [Kiritimatiellota bacterium]MBL7015969.1 glycosyltransferase family 2 protein [Kiritimatiellales bacterium]